MADNDAATGPRHFGGAVDRPHPAPGPRSQAAVGGPGLRLLEPATGLHDPLLGGVWADPQALRGSDQVPGRTQRASPSRHFDKGENKEAIVAPLIEAAAREGGEGRAGDQGGPVQRRGFVTHAAISSNCFRCIRRTLNLVGEH